MYLGMYNLIPNLSVRENIEVGVYLSDRPLELDELQTLGCITSPRCRTSLPADSSRGRQSGVQSSKIRHSSCDEPTGALDYKTSKEIPLCLIEQINQKYGNTVIMVTHNDAIKICRPKCKAQGRTDPWSCLSKPRSQRADLECKAVRI